MLSSRILVLFLSLTLVTNSWAGAIGASTGLLPQPKAANGPWFEGWYVRVTDPEKGLSFATITTSSTSQKIPLSSGSVLPGYIAFLYNLSGQTHSVEYFPKETGVQIDDSVPHDAHFQWEAPGFGTLTDRSLELALPSGDEISLNFGARMPWRATAPNWGPEGWVAKITKLPLHWYVDSLGTPVTYRLKIAGTNQTVEGHGYAHVEKNWGRIFPKAWMWAEAISPDNSAHLALAGGPLDVGPLRVTSYLIGYKTRDLNIEIRPDQGWPPSYRTVIDGRHGNFTIEASNAKYRLLVEAKAPRTSFAPVSAPTETGYKTNGGMESFATEIRVSVFQGARLVESRVFHGAALEFGANDMNTGLAE